MALPEYEKRFNYEKRGRLVAEAKVLTSGITKLEVTGLDIIRDGYVYDIEIAEFAPEPNGSGAGHMLRINNLVEGYSSTEWGFMSSSQDFFTLPITLGLAYTNGWTSGNAVCFTSGTLNMYNGNWISFTGQTNLGSYDNTQRLNLIHFGNMSGRNEVETNINSLQIVSIDGKELGVG